MNKLPEYAMPVDPNQIKSIFLAAAEKATPAERAAFLDETCAGDGGLRRRVEELLRAHDRPDSFLEKPPAAAGGTGDYRPGNLSAAEPCPLGESPGTRIGPYKLLEPIGEGGMGTVWMAEQQQPVRRLVALKVIKAGLDSAQVVARFEAERQTLALMDHPHIARVFDGGTTASGRPYFVMELVKGTPITQYCDEHRLTPRQRLELFIPVCQAIQHAHQKGIIHRDVKPSNVLVAPYDGKPVVKVIDFGVAKATGQRLTERTLFTGFGAVVGTLEYMSPEQAELNNQDIDTRSDLYSLGVLLYELLTGTTPLTKERLKHTPFPELLRLIREEEPPKPSTRLSSSDTLAALAAARQTEPAKLTRLVRGELDWIVVKALDKDRNRRYESASALAADVLRYLNDEPVVACPPSASYRLRKFVRRNKGPVLAVCVFILLLAAGIVGTTTGLVRALAAEQQTRTERDQKDEALGKVEKEVRQKQEALRQVVKERDQKEENWRKARRAFQMLTHDVVGELLGRQVHMTDRHREFLNRVLAEHAALAAAKAGDPEGRQNQAEGLFLVGLIRHRLGELKKAEGAYRDGVALQKQLAADFPTRPEYRFHLALSYTNLGALLSDTGRPKEAEVAYRDGLALRKKLTADFPSRPEYHHELVQSYTNLANLLDNTARPKEAEAAYRDALAISQRLAADFPDSPAYREDVARSHNNLAVLLYHTGRPKEAEESWRDALAVRKRLAADFPTVPDRENDLAVTFMNLGNLLRDTGQPKEAEAAYREALAIGKQLAADFPNRPDFRSDLAVSHYNAAILLHKTGRPTEAEAAMRNALALHKQLAADFPNRIDFRRSLAKTYTAAGALWHDTGRLKETEAVLRDALVLQKQLAADFANQPEFRQDLALTHNNLGHLLRVIGRRAEAEAAYHGALVLQKKLAADFPDRPDYRSELAGSYYNQGILLHLTQRPKEAEVAWRNSLALRKQLTVHFPKVPDYQNDLAATLTSLATLLRFTGRPKEAEAACGEALAIGKRLTADFPNRPEFRSVLALTLNNLGVLLSSLQRQEEAEAAYNGALVLWKELIKDVPNQPFFRQEQARTYNNLGVVLTATRRPKEAEAAYRDALALWKQLADEFPNRPDFRQELARAYDNLNRLLRATRRPKEGEAASRQALAVRKSMAADFPNVPDYQNELAGTLVNLAGLHKQRRQFAAAVALLEEARPHHQAALKVNPKHPTYRNFYRNNLWILADCRLGLADHARLATTADELARFGYDPANDTYRAACYLCHCVVLADKDTSLNEAKRKELARSYTDRALAMLRQAVARGFKDVAHLKKNPDFEPLRSREDFKMLLANLEGK
jgi:serine/threonine protein kinase